MMHGMEASEVPRSYVDPDGELAARDRPGFVPACCYHSMSPEKTELGGIFKPASNWRVDRGMVVSSAECVERIFVKEPT
jgi:hypothetical protein